MFLFLYIFLFSYSIEASAQTAQPTGIISSLLSKEPANYISKSLQPLIIKIQNLISTSQDPTSYIQKYFKTSALPQRLNNKLLNFFIGQISEFNITNEINLNSKTLLLKIYPLFDFIDLLQVLGIKIEDSDFLDPWVEEQIRLYQKKHFPSDETTKNLKEVVENNFRLYDTWKNRVKGFSIDAVDIPMPEAIAVYFYYRSFFRLYVKMLKNDIFREFLNKRSDDTSHFYNENNRDKSLYDHVSLLLNNSTKFDDLVLKNDTNTYSNFSHYKLIEMDNIYRLLVDSALCSKELLSKIFPDNFDAGLLIKNTLNPRFFLCSIGALSHTPLIMTLGIPGISLHDVSLSLVPFDSKIGTLTSRRNHDIDHHAIIIGSIFLSDEFREYYTENTLEYIKKAFLEFLSFCDKNFTPDELKILLKSLVDFHHEKLGNSLPISRNFVPLLLNAHNNRVLEPQDNFNLSLERQESIIKNWYKVWKTFPLKTRPPEESFKALIVEGLSRLLRSHKGKSSYFH